MSNSSENKNPLDLSGLDFGPAWAKDKGEKKSYQKYDHLYARNREFIVNLEWFVKKKYNL